RVTSVGNKAGQCSAGWIPQFQIVHLLLLRLAFDELEQGLFRFGVRSADSAVGSERRRNETPSDHPVRNQKERGDADHVSIALSVNILGLMIKSSFHHALPCHLVEKGP